jgi:tetratricopeptide (TPR) repeat protein
MAVRVSAQLQQAVALHRAGQLAQARVMYEAILRLQPRHADAWHLLGVIALQSGDARKGLDWIDRAIGIEPHQARFHGNRGSALQDLRQFDAALTSFDRALALEPKSAELHFNRGNALRDLGKWSAALAGYDEAIALNPDFARAHFNRGNALQVLGQREAALASYQRSIALEPTHAEAHFNRGVVLRELGRFQEALASYDEALALDPQFAEAQLNRANLLKEQLQLESALVAYERLLEARRDDAEAHTNRALALLMLGDFERGWPEYEWRWLNKHSSNFHERREFALPLWLGQAPIVGRTLLLHAEQGHGDTLQFCRYVAPLAAQGARIILEVQAPLAPLLARLEGVSQLIVRGTALPSFDYHCPLLSLPLACHTELRTIPSGKRYLSAEPERIDRWRGRLGLRAQPRIGLAWSGSTTHNNDRQRSIALAQWLPHLPAGFQYVSLQKELRAPDAEALAGSKIMTWAEELRDFADTAALSECMDLVISVDTSVAHLSAALGKSTWILLPYVPDWRWLLHRCDSPWYPSVTLYRQTRIGDWEAVLRQIGAALTRAFQQ